MFRKIRDARSNVDNICKIKQICPSDSVRRLKLQQLDDDRNIEIQRENNRLLYNISRIITQKRGRTSRHQGALDSGSSIMSRRSSNQSVLSGKNQSLHTSYKKKVQKKIDLENMVSIQRTS